MVGGQVIVIMLFALALRLINLGGPALWYDESGSVWMASLPFDRMIAATAGDTHPPLYLALLWAWVRVAGLSPFAVRLPSLVFSAAAIPVLWKIGERLALGKTAITAAALLVAVLPSQLHYAQETRMYSLLQLELLIAVWGALSWRWWVMGLGLALMLWTHNYGLMYFAPVAALGLWQVWQQCKSQNVAVLTSWPLMSWLWACLLAVVVWFPWFAALVQQMRDVAAGYWLSAVTPGSVVYPLYFVWWGFAPTGEIQVHAALLAFGALGFALVKAIRARHVGALSLLALALGPWAAAIAVSVVWQPVLLFRGLFPSSALLALAVAWSVTDGVSLPRRWWVAYITAPTVLAITVAYFLSIGNSKGGALHTAEVIAWKPGDIVYHVNDGSLMALHFYTPEAWPQFVMPAAARNLGALSDRTREAMGFRIAPLGDVAWHRAWVVYAGSPTTAAAEDEALQNLLTEYPHQLVRDVATDLTHEAVYLIWNKGVGVP